MKTAKEIQALRRRSTQPYEEFGGAVVGELLDELEQTKNNIEKKIVDWLRKSADNWQTEEGPHTEPRPGCTCCFACQEAVTYRIIADAIEAGEHRKDS